MFVLKKKRKMKKKVKTNYYILYSYLNHVPYAEIGASFQQ